MYTEHAPPFSTAPPIFNSIPQRGIFLPWGDLFLYKPTHVLSAGAAVTRYHDGKMVVYQPQPYDPDYSLEANCCGYGRDTGSYGLDLQMTYHWLAWALGLPTSRCVYAEAHGTLEQCIADDEANKVPFPFGIADEERISYAMMAYARTGQLDAWGVLRGLWGNNIARAATHLMAFWQPWLRPPAWGKPPRANVSVEATGLPLYLETPDGPAKG